MIIVAPTEHALHELLAASKEKWKISSLPEKHGADILVPTKQGVVGFQRKTLQDLVASLQDGRLYYELNQFNSSATVSHPYLCIESSFTTTIDGACYTEANISVSTVRSVIAKFAFHGVGYIPTSSPSDTLSAVIGVSRYLSSGSAGVIHRTKQTANEWGQATNKSYGVFLLQSFPGIGPKVAEAIYQHFNSVPIGWTVTAADLARVPGVGRKRAEALIAALRPAVPAPGTIPPA